jgi:flagellar motor switch protein FliM
MQTGHPIFQDLRGQIVVSVSRPQTNRLVNHLFASLGDINSGEARAFIASLKLRIQMQSELRVGDFINIVHECAAAVFGPIKGSEIRNTVAGLSNNNLNVASSGQLRDDQKLDPSYLLMILR